MIVDIVYWTATIIGIVGCLFFLIKSWKHYGLLLVISATVAIILCYIFVRLGFYSFPFTNGKFPIPYTAMTFTFPLGVMFTVRYSPNLWRWKIPFYWGFIHLGVFTEILLREYLQMIVYKEWDLWDTYTWWWIYFLFFEWIGGKIIPKSFRKPLDHELFMYGRIGWITFHFVVILTIFLAGFYLGKSY